MKRFVAATLAAASVGGSMLAAAPAFASSKWVTLTVQPDATHNGTAVAITAACTNKNAYVVVKSLPMRFIEKGEKGKQLDVELKVGWAVFPGTYTIIAQCIPQTGIPGAFTTQTLTVKHAVPLIPLKPGKPKPPIPDIPGFKYDVVVETGFGGMARLRLR